MPPLVYIALIALGSVLLARDLYEQHVAADAAAANKVALDETTRASIGGINYGITLYRWSPSKSPLGVGDPLTTRNSYSLEIAPRGSDCAHGPVQRAQIELQSPALNFEPVRPVSIDMAALQQYYCAVTPSAAAPPAYHWDVLAKQDGDHVLAVRVAGLDKNGNEVSANPTLKTVRRERQPVHAGRSARHARGDRRRHRRALRARRPHLGPRANEHFVTSAAVGERRSCGQTVRPPLRSFSMSVQTVQTSVEI